MTQYIWQYTCSTMFQGGQEVVYCYEGGEGRANVEQGVCRKHCSGKSYTILHCKDFVKCFGRKLMFDNILKLFSDRQLQGLCPSGYLCCSRYFLMTWRQRVVFTYLLWNITILSAYRSLISICFPFVLTSGCFLTISHPTCEKKKPLLALWGSASVSEYLWWTRWSLTHSKMSFWALMQFINIRNNLRDQVALNERCDHNRCAPIVIPAPPKMKQTPIQTHVHGFVLGRI